MKRLVVDLDHTICKPAAEEDQTKDPTKKYSEAAPIAAFIAQLRRYKELGFEIVVHTARNMRTYSGDVDKIREHTLPVIIDWLARHDVPFDEVIIGKPWCGFDGFYIDDRAIRPSEFVSMGFEELTLLLDRERLGE